MEHNQNKTDKEQQDNKSVSGRNVGNYKEKLIDLEALEQAKKAHESAKGANYIVRK